MTLKAVYPNSLKYHNLLPHTMAIFLEHVLKDPSCFFLGISLTITQGLFFLSNVDVYGKYENIQPFMSILKREGAAHKYPTMATL